MLLCATWVLVLAWTGDPDDPQREISLEAYDCLSRETDARGRRFEIFKLRQPEPMFITQAEVEGLAASGQVPPLKAGDRLPASYVNFYIANRGIVMPCFDAPTDSQAARTLQDLFPDREIVAVPAREFLLGGGVHCLVQPIPLGR